MKSSGKLTIGYVTDGLSSHSGTERYSRSLIESVSAQAEVRVLTYKYSHNDTRVDDVHAILPPVRFRPLTQCIVAWQIIRHLRGCDVIHVLVEPYAPAAALAGLLLRTPVTMTLHGTYAVPPAQRSFKRTMMRFMYARMPIVTTGSLHTERKVRELLPHALRECRMIPNGVDLDRFHQLAGVHKEDLVLTVGMLKPRKGVDTVLEAVALLKEKRPTLHYAVVGDDGHDSFSEKVHAMAEGTALQGRVSFHEGISDTELLSLYNRAKAFILAARETNDGAFEGFPMVFYEANACGTPVITTRGFGSEYAIHDGKNGFLVEQNDPAGVAEAIEKLYANGEQYVGMQKHSLEEAAAHTWDKIAHSLLTMYRDIIAHV